MLIICNKSCFSVFYDILLVDILKVAASHDPTSLIMHYELCIMNYAL